MNLVYNLEDNVNYRFRETVLGIPVIAFMDIFHTDTQQFHLGIGGVFSFAMNQNVFAQDEVEPAYTNTESLAYINAGITIGFEYNVLVVEKAGLSLGLWTFSDMKNPLMHCLQTLLIQDLKLGGLLNSKHLQPRQI
ncbi:MAG: hypothetical protein KGZ97_03070 [Bacteroidetes bacterium]|nr:hypothetical protein [Bacteroidota bacterium]